LTPIATDIIRPIDEAALASVRSVESEMLAVDQTELPVHHTLHGGAYTRSLRIPAGVMICGALIKVPTTLIVNGNVTVWANDQAIDIDGYQVLVGAAGRKQLFYAHEDTDMTMVFATSAKTVDEAEREFTDEWDMLASREHPDLNTEIVTGE
jgi:hypothetical protein